MLRCTRLSIGVFDAGIAITTSSHFKLEPTEEWFHVHKVKKGGQSISLDCSSFNMTFVEISCLGKADLGCGTSSQVHVTWLAAALGALPLCPPTASTLGQLLLCPQSCQLTHQLLFDLGAAALLTAAAVAIQSAANPGPRYASRASITALYTPAAARSRYAGRQLVPKLQCPPCRSAPWDRNRTPLALPPTSLPASASAAAGPPASPLALLLLFLLYLQLVLIIHNHLILILSPAATDSARALPPLARPFFLCSARPAAAAWRARSLLRRVARERRCPKGAGLAGTGAAGAGGRARRGG